jgi:hypothetical protein
MNQFKAGRFEVTVDGSDIYTAGLVVDISPSPLSEHLANIKAMLKGVDGICGVRGHTNNFYGNTRLVLQLANELFDCADVEQKVINRLLSVLRASASSYSLAEDPTSKQVHVEITPTPISRFGPWSNRADFIIGTDRRHSNELVEKLMAALPCIDRAYLRKGDYNIKVYTHANAQNALRELNWHVTRVMFEHYNLTPPSKFQTAG